MKKHHIAAKYSPSSSFPSLGSSDSGLALLVEQAPKRIAALAASLGVFFFINAVLNFVGPNSFGWHAACAQIGFVTNSALTGGSVALFLITRRYGEDNPKLMIGLGKIYVILAAFAVSYSEQITPGAGSGPSFVAVLIVLFPLFVPSGIGVTLMAGFGAALMSPLAAFTFESVSGLTLEGSMTARYSLNVVAALLALVPASIVTKMSRDVSRARQLGSYELSALIGRGGMGEVWRGSHRMLRRPAAIKVIDPRALGAATPSRASNLLSRFEREAQATAALHSPHTIQLYDFGTTELGSFFYVMELLEGFDLETLVTRFGPISPARCVKLLKQVADSLEDAHLSELIHRDIKPANIFVCRYGHKLDFIKVLDFGLVKAANANSSDEVKLTADGATAGTPSCMAPEMALGEAAIDGRADIYALGCVAYWLLTGQMVFEADSNMKMVLQHIQATPVPPSQRTEMAIPAALERLVLDCLEKSPSKRPQTAAELCQRLDALDLEEVWSPEREKRWWQAHDPAVDAPVSQPEVMGTTSLVPRAAH